MENLTVLGVGTRWLGNPIFLGEKSDEALGPCQKCAILSTVWIATTSS